MALLKTVRAKLTTLVALSALATLSALPLLHWLMTRELMDVVDDRVPEAVRGFDLELADDIHDLEAATKSLGDSDDLQAAVKNGSSTAAEEELKVFHEAYPGTGFIVYRADGVVVGQGGIAGTALPRGSFVGLEALARGTDEARVVATDGCSTTKSADPSYVMARPIRGSGTIVACMRIDAKYLSNSSAKLGIELAVAQGPNSVGTKTPAFPVAALAGDKSDALVDVDGRAWATTKWEPAALTGVPGCRLPAKEREQAPRRLAGGRIRVEARSARRRPDLCVNGGRRGTDRKSGARAPASR